MKPQKRGVAHEHSGADAAVVLGILPTPPTGPAGSPASLLLLSVFLTGMRLSTCGSDADES